MQQHVIQQMEQKRIKAKAKMKKQGTAVTTAKSQVSLQIVSAVAGEMADSSKTWSLRIFKWGSMWQLYMMKTYTLEK